MPHHAVTCPACRRKFPPEQLTGQGLQPCRNCGTPVQVLAFPALYRPPDVPRSERVIDDSSSCFFHPGNQAAQVCSSCGRFLCALCAFEWGAQELCPHCLEKGRQQGRSLFTVRAHRYDNIALALVFLPPIVFWPATPVTAFAALFMAVRGWRRPTEVLPLSRVKLSLAILLALLQWVGIVAGLIYLVVWWRTELP